jgi:N-acetylglucosaminyl-diphospho-decaprenol L-rhamnosyltransferase
VVAEAQRVMQIRSSPVAVVMITKDRRERVLDTLPRLLSLPEQPQVVVVDDGGADGTAEAVAAAHPGVEVVRLDVSRGGAARTVGVEQVDRPVVAFADDDSWWAPGALGRAAEVLAAHPAVGLLVGRVLVGETGRDDPINAALRDSPLGADGLPGPEVLGFLACGAVVRREAYLEVGGFHPRFGVGGEEELLALDLRRAGWRSAYVQDVVAHHHPDAADCRPARHQRQARNALWTAWLRRPAVPAGRATASAARRAVGDRAVRAGVLEAVGGLPWVLRERAPVPPDLEADLRVLAAAGA